MCFLNEEITVTPFSKQLFVAASPLLAALSVGGAVSFPTVLLHQLRSNGTTIHLDFDTASWMGSIHGLAGLPSILLPIIMQWRGRKFTFIASCLITMLGWVVAYSASSAAVLLVSESLHGLGTNSILAVSCLCISEMIAPNYRQVYMSLYVIFQVLTMALNGLMTQYLHWKTICIVMCVPIVIAVVMSCMWPESPYWLAIEGKYEECEKAFTWLRGTDNISKKELRQLILVQKETTSNRDKISFSKFWNKITSRDFYLPSIHMFVLQYLFYWSGNYVILIYSIELIKKTTQNEKASLFGGLIMNSILLLGIVMCLVLTRYFSKKSILLWSTLFMVMSMSSASLVSYLQTKGTVPEDSLLCLYCFLTFMLANGTGVEVIAYSIAIEIMPVKHRGIGGALIVVCSCVLHSSSLKMSPYLFLYINYWGTFIFYSLNSILCVLFIWKYVPETTGKTLQEIENYYTYGRFYRQIDEDVTVQITNLIE